LDHAASIAVSLGIGCEDLRDVGINNAETRVEGTFTYLRESRVPVKHCPSGAVGTAMATFEADIDAEQGQSLLGEFPRASDAGFQVVGVSIHE